jgi:hypothetical protein
MVMVDDDYIEVAGQLTTICREATALIPKVELKLVSVSNMVEQHLYLTASSTVKERAFQILMSLSDQTHDFIFEDHTD